MIYLIHEINEFIHIQGMSLDCGNGLPHIKCIDIAEATTCSLSSPVRYHDYGKNLFNFLSEKLNLGRYHTYISHFTNIVYQTFQKQISRYLASYYVIHDYFIVQIWKWTIWNRLGLVKFDINENTRMKTHIANL